MKSKILRRATVAHPSKIVSAANRATESETKYLIPILKPQKSFHRLIHSSTIKKQQFWLNVHPTKCA